jgi:hypothetical protein
MDLQMRAQAAYALYQERSTTERRQEFQIRDLVLTKLRPHELERQAIKDGSRKLAPKWSLPFRVVRVLSSGQTAMLTALCGPARLREAHIRDCRFIDEPKDEVQKAYWESVAENVEVATAFNPSELREVLDEQYEDIKRPQKRRRD